MSHMLSRVFSVLCLLLLTALPVYAQDAPSYSDAFNDLHAELGKRYAFFELKGIDWDVVGKQFLPRAESVKDDAAFGLLCAELVAQLQDSHAQLLPGEAKLPTVDFPRWHAGFACLEDDQGDTIVYHVVPSSPAQQAGVKVGMRLIAIDNKPVRQAIEDMTKQVSRWQGYSSPQYLRYHAVRWCNRRVKQYDPVELLFQNNGEGELVVKLPAVVDGGYIPRLPVPNPGINDSGDVTQKMLDNGVGYLYVRRIRPDLNDKLNAAVTALKDAKALIIDVRGNSGGGFDAKTSHLNFELDESKQQADRPVFTGPIAVLIDARCISAGEGWASWFVANKRATLIGEPTAGASSRKDVYTLTNNTFKVRFSVKAYKGYLDRPIEHLGLTPDIPATQTREDLIAGKDTVLEKAKAFLVEQINAKAD